MTIHSVHSEGGRLTLRYFPLLAWAFIGVTSYGVGTIVTATIQGVQTFDSKALIALAALVTMVLFVAVTSGQFVICTFDREQNHVEVVRYGLHGRAVYVRMLNDIVGIEVRALRRAQHRIELQLRSGERLALTPYYVMALKTNDVQQVGRLLGIEPVVTQHTPRLF